MIESTLAHYFQNLVLVPLTLLPLINPLTGAPVFIETAGDDPATVRRMARQVAINCLLVIVTALLIGTYVLKLFGISLPIVRIAGGLLVAATAWRMLQSGDDDEVKTAVARVHPGQLTKAEIARRSFFPITFPLTTGPGTIAASIALGATWPRQAGAYVIDAVVAIAGACLTVLVIYLVYRHAVSLMRRLGEVGSLVMMRLMAFVLMCIGIQIIWIGWAELNGLPMQ